MRYAHFRLIAAPAIASYFCMPAHAAPIANLPLTCSSASAIGQPQNNCSGVWAYQAPDTEQLIVLKGPSTAPIWNRATDLVSTDTLAVCSLPVEPGTYSSCKDSAGVRRIVYVAKSQVFASSPPPPPPPTSGARILDLSRVPVEITQPGVYVFDRDWPGGSSANGAIVITADDVTLDLQGFELTAEFIGIASTGLNVIIRNGRVRVRSGIAIRASGALTRIERMRASVEYGGAVALGGFGSTLTDSVASVAEGGTAVSAGDDTIVRDNQISSHYSAMTLGSRTTVVDNQISSCVYDPCITINGSNNIVSRNTIRALSNGNGFLILGDQNMALANIFLGCQSGSAAIVVEGQGNTIRDNLVPKCAGTETVWGVGIDFHRDGNFYGDNTVWATAPFGVGATVQTDLGGNVGFSN